MYAFVKTCQVVHLRFVPFTVGKFYHTHTHKIPKQIGRLKCLKVKHAYVYSLLWSALKKKKGDGLVGR